MESCHINNMILITGLSKNTIKDQNIVLSNHPDLWPMAAAFDLDFDLAAYMYLHSVYLSSSWPFSSR